jgi:hypothetical protein
MMGMADTLEEEAQEVTTLEEEEEEEEEEEAATEEMVSMDDTETHRDLGAEAEAHRDPGAEAVALETPLGRWPCQRHPEVANTIDSGGHVKHNTCQKPVFSFNKQCKNKQCNV